VTRKDHVTCVVHDDCIRMSRGIVQKLSNLFIVFSVGFASCVGIDPSAASIVLLMHCA
jgi:hypothetical protein